MATNQPGFPPHNFWQADLDGKLGNPVPVKGVPGLPVAQLINVGDSRMSEWLTAMRVFHVFLIQDRSGNDRTGGLEGQYHTT